MVRYAATLRGFNTAHSTTAIWPSNTMLALTALTTLIGIRVHTRSDADALLGGLDVGSG